MQIIWKEKGILKIIGEHNTILINPDKNDEASVVIDPINAKDFGKTNSFIIDNPGEYEINEDFIYKSFFINKDNITVPIYKINVDNITILDLNNINQDISSRIKDEDSFEDIIDGNIDILLMPIGEGYITPKLAESIKNTLGPRIIIPINYDEEKDIKNLLEFRKFFPNVNDVDKFKIAKKNLPEEETVLTILKQSK